MLVGEGALRLRGGCHGFLQQPFLKLLASPKTISSGIHIVFWNLSLAGCSRGPQEQRTDTIFFALA